MKLTVVLAFGAATLGFGMGKQRGTTTKPSVAQSPSIVGQSSPMQQFAPLQPAPPARTSRKMTKDIPLAAADQEVLKQDPKTEAIKEMDDTRQMRLSECRATIANPTQELCERILQANGHAIQRSIEIKQRFLRGEIDQDTFQSEFHKMFLLRSVELEHILSAKDFLSHEHIPVGQDTFIDRKSVV